MLAKFGKIDQPSRNARQRCQASAAASGRWTGRSGAWAKAWAAPGETTTLWPSIPAPALLQAERPAGRDEAGERLGGAHRQAVGGEAPADVLEQRPQPDEVGHEHHAAQRLAVGAGVVGGHRCALDVEGDPVDGGLLRT